jgi:sensor domain CHASE-containing protein
VRLREPGVKLLVILNFALEIGGQSLNTSSRKDAEDAKGDVELTGSPLLVAAKIVTSAN